MSTLFKPEKGVAEVGKPLIELGEKALQGEVNPLELKLYLKLLAEVISKVEEQIEDIALTEASKYEKGGSMYGYEISVVENSGRYTYDHIPEIVQAKQKVKELEKKAQAALSAIRTGIEMTDTETGDVLTPAVYVLNKTYIKLQKKKEGRQ